MDITAQFAKIAPAFIEGEKADKLNALRSRNFPNEELKRAAFAEVEKEYDQHNVNAVKPVVQKLSYIITTEVLYIPIKNDVPDVDNMQVVSQQLSDKKARALKTILTNPIYMPDDEVPYLQVSISFPAGKRQESGQALPTGITKDYRVERRYPDAFNNIKSFMEMLPLDSELIAAHNISYKKYTETQIRNALMQYAAMQAYCIEALDEVHDNEMYERVVTNGKVLDDLSILPSLKKDTLVERIREEIAKESGTPVEEDTTSNETQSSDDLPPTLDNLMEQPHIGDDDTLVDIDLD